MDTSTQGIIVGLIVFLAVYGLNLLKVNNVLIVGIVVVIALISMWILKKVKY